MSVKTPRARAKRTALSAAAAISFSLTFVVFSLAMLAGVIPERTLLANNEIDVNVLLLFVPLCALVFAIFVEVVRLIVKGNVKIERPRTHNPLSAWRPGHEG